MKVAVIGAGIIGITTAYELAMDGHEVTVFERRSAAAEETSFANAGIVAPGYVTPWAAPGMPGKVLSYLFSRHAPVRLSLPLSTQEMAWMWKWMRACKLEIYLANRARLQRLAFYSRHRLHLLTAERELDYERSAGYMVLLRSEKDSQLVQPGLQVLRDAGVNFREISADETRQIEPALNTETSLLGAIHLPDDEVANCRQFALMLKEAALQLGVNFQFNTTVAQLERAHPATLLIAGETQPHRFDQVVMCAGLASAALLKPLGAEIGGSLAHKREASIKTLYKVLQDWFPGAAQLTSSNGNVQVWKGARPMLPDGPPLIGNSGLPGLWLNLGHGSSGWALSCGSARALADLMAGRPPEIDMEGLDISRLG